MNARARAVGTTLVGFWLAGALGLGMAAPATGPGERWLTAASGSVVVQATGTPASAAATAPVDPADVPQDDGITQDEGGGGGARNLVQIQNRTDGRLRVRGNIQLNRILAPSVEPVNLALALGSCTDCQTFAVALQLDLISRTASQIAPQNAAVAVNVDCTRCVTVARAFQYVYQVDDPTQVPGETSELIRAMDHELQAIHSDGNVTLSDAEARINAVIAQFTTLAESLDDKRAEETRPTSPDMGPQTTVTPTPGGIATPSGAEATPTATPNGADGTATATPNSAEATPTATPSGVDTLPTATATTDPAPAPTAAPSATATLQVTAVPTAPPATGVAASTPLAGTPTTGPPTSAPSPAPPTGPPAVSAAAPRALQPAPATPAPGLNAVPTARP
jgi:hypothetical protein